MTRAKQSNCDRLARLLDGRCPVHGGFMSQVGLTDIVNGQQLFIAGCSRKGCDIRATTSEPYGASTLLPAFSHLVAQ